MSMKRLAEFKLWRNVLAWVLLLPAGSQAATTLMASYRGGEDPTTSAPTGTLVWRGESLGNTNVSTHSEVVEGRTVLAMTDPGIAQDGRMNNLYYNARPTASQIDALVSSGFDLVLSLKIPGLDDMPGPAWTRDSNTSLGFYYVDPLVSGQRRSWSLALGRNSSGNTLVSFVGNSQVLELSPDFHEYRIAYRDGLATLFVDGEARLTTVGSTSSTTSTVNMLYWGDNNNSATATAYGSRTAYFESVELIQIPEPKRVFSMMLGVVLLLAWYRRRI